ncbi:crotonase/enoyl-CoA hydratase family protein [Marinobacteraceae bacterium S3BR75-40.1]
MSETLSAEVLCHTANRVAEIRLNRPETRNAISDDAMIDALVGALEAADADPEVRVLVLTGEGSAFCSGGNVKDMAARKGLFSGTPAEIADNYQRGIQRIPKAFAALRKPVVAAVNGPAYGAGCDLAMMCDLRLASENARFAENFVRVGLIPGDGGAWFLPRIVGHARASEMALTGEPVDAHTAQAWGMVSRVVAPEHLLEEAHALAAKVADNPPFAVRATKQLLSESAATDLDTFLKRCAQIQGVAHHAEDHLEAVNAFLEKRPPHFHDR